ncbi:MAG TPA: ribbon-helix-helix protein, CopG family [Anaeromyxobacter sp.]|nr:ribbon-helix-helix protein, CopG family [Anaeromyxobacter sp.]
MALVNVKLQPEDVERVRALRESGVSLSGIVRAAIRAEYDRRVRPSATRRPSQVVAALLASIPAGPRARTGPPASDRRAVRAYVVAKLKRRHP